MLTDNANYAVGFRCSRADKTVWSLRSTSLTVSPNVVSTLMTFLDKYKFNPGNVISLTDPSCMKELGNTKMMDKYSGKEGGKAAEKGWKSKDMAEEEGWKSKDKYKSKKSKYSKKASKGDFDEDDAEEEMEEQAEEPQKVSKKAGLLAGLLG